MNKKTFLIVSLAIASMASCKKPTVGDFLREVSQEESYRKTVSSGDFNLMVIYRPSELICLSERVKDPSRFKFNDALFKKDMEKYQNAGYFDFTISMKNGKNPMINNVANQSEYASRLGELTYLIPNYCYIVADNKDTIHPLTCNFSNTYENTNDIKMMVVFPKNEITRAEESLNFVYEDKTFGIPEKSVFYYTANEINKELPKLTE